MAMEINIRQVIAETAKNLGLRVDQLELLLSQERFMARLSSLPQGSNFVWKGGSLILRLYQNLPQPRYTLDIDLLLQDLKMEKVENIFELAMKVQLNDSFEFLSIKKDFMKRATPYGGERYSINWKMLGKPRSQPLRIDVCAGDTHHAGFWTLDPIDGTKGFLRGQQYAIALAYVERGEPVVGVLGCPNLAKDFSVPLDEADGSGCLYVAMKGDGVEEYAADDVGAGGVTINRLDHVEGEAISVCASVEKTHSSVSDTDRVMELVAKGNGSQGAMPPVRLDSQAKYAVVARGQADAYLRLPAKRGYIERIWDHAAGALVASEAGCFVTDIYGRGLDFTHGRGLEKNRGIVCAPPRVHGLVIGAIEELGLGRS